MKSSRRTVLCSVPLALSWSHSGVAYRVTAWPEVQFERLYGDEWIPTSPTEEALASAAQDCGPAEWAAYLDFVPAAARRYIERFSFGRMEALQTIARCPELLADLDETPALTSFVASHANLRGTAGACWQEIAAVHERAGVFGLLEWLGLPASRQTLSILRSLSEPDLAKRFLRPLRALLWEPHATFALRRMSSIDDRQLSRCCHALAA